jgi:RNA-binding protein
MITTRVKRRIKHKLSDTKPTIRIGKNGITREVIAEINGRLEKTEMLKAKILKTALTEAKATAIATEIAQQTDAILVEVRGHTFMLYRKKRKKQELRKKI